MTGRSGVGAILLAAGRSRRMGTVNKLLLDIDGEPMVRRAVRAMLDSRVEETVVVLGHQSAAVADALSGLPLRMVSNPAHDEGQMTSMRCGLAALPDRYQGILVALADQPDLTPADIDLVIDAFLSGDRNRVVVPVRQGRRGNPIVLAADLRADFAGRSVNYGCRNLIERHPDLVQAVEVQNDRYFNDIDTPEDLAALRRI